MSLLKDGAHGQGGQSMTLLTAAAGVIGYPDVDTVSGQTSVAASSEFAPGSNSEGCLDRFVISLGANTGDVRIENHDGTRVFWRVTNTQVTTQQLEGELGINVSSEPQAPSPVVPLVGGFRLVVTNSSANVYYRRWRTGNRPADFGPNAD